MFEEMDKIVNELYKKADEQIAYLKGYERGLREGAELATSPSKAMATLIELSTNN
jgi:hypothetical protein